MGKVLIFEQVCKVYFGQTTGGQSVISPFFFPSQLAKVVNYSDRQLLLHGSLFFFTLLTTLEIETKVVSLYLLNAIIESNQDNLCDFNGIINRIFFR